MARPPKASFNPSDQELVPFCETRVSASVFDAWLGSDAQSDYRKLEGTKSPRQTLQALVDTQLELHAPDGTKASMSIMEGIMGRYVSLALEGNLAAIDGVVKELQHEGVQKVAVAHVDVLPPGAKFILDQVGFVPRNVIEGSKIDETIQTLDTLHENKTIDSKSFLDGLDD